MTQRNTDLNFTLEKGLYLQYKYFSAYSVPFLRPLCFFGKIPEGSLTFHVFLPSRIGEPSFPPASLGDDGRQKHTSLDLCSGRLDTWVGRR